MMDSDYDPAPLAESSARMTMSDRPELIIAPLTAAETEILRAAVKVLARFVLPAPSLEICSSEENWISLKSAATRALRSDDTILLWIRRSVVRVHPAVPI
jgi:hypothetical protein